MGEETVDMILSKHPKLEVKYESTQTRNFNLIGSYSKSEAISGLVLGNDKLFKQYEDHLVLTRDLPRDVAKHLIHTYGTTCLRVVDLGEQNSKNKRKGANTRIHADYPFLMSEIAYAATSEMAQKPNDIICRRVPIAFLNKEVAKEILPEVVEILGKQLNWSSTRKTEETKEALEMLTYLK